MAALDDSYMMHRTSLLVYPSSDKHGGKNSIKTIKLVFKFKLNEAVIYHKKYTYKGLMPIISW